MESVIALTDYLEILSLKPRDCVLISTSLHSWRESAVEDIRLPVSNDALHIIKCTGLHPTPGLSEYQDLEAVAGAASLLDIPGPCIRDSHASDGAPKCSWPADGLEYWLKQEFVLLYTIYIHPQRNSVAVNGLAWIVLSNPADYPVP
jgi:hypothetical protein